VQAAEAEAFASLADDQPHESVGALYPDWIGKRPGAIRAHVSNAEFFDIGTPADYLRTCQTLAAREGHPLNAASVVWDDVVIEPGARVRGSVVTDGVRLPAGDWFDMTIRRAEGDLEPFEERRNNLAIAPLAR
jgi:NDP-sugar pyrophosphorylase family protein